MGDPWGTGDFRGGGESIEGANRKKNQRKISKIGRNSDFFFFFFDWNSINSIGTDSKPL